MTDEERRLLVALERGLARDASYRRLSRAVTSAQRALRNAIGEDAWRLYLVVEERTNARHVAVVAAALRLAVRSLRRKR